MMESRQEQPRPKFNFERGDEVRVIDGPFGNFNGRWRRSITTRAS